jgi:lipid-binding SYLF domain-containing protein
MTFLFANTAFADNYQKTTALFKNSNESANYFSNSYGYAVFPSIGKGGIGIGGAHGNGGVFVAGKQVGDTSMTQLTIGFQLGGQAYSQIIFLKDKRALLRLLRERLQALQQQVHQPVRVQVKNQRVLQAAINMVWQFSLLPRVA